MLFCHIESKMDTKTTSDSGFNRELWLFTPLLLLWRPSQHFEPFSASPSLLPVLRFYFQSVTRQQHNEIYINALQGIAILAFRHYSWAITLFRTSQDQNGAKTTSGFGFDHMFRLCTPTLPLESGFVAIYLEALCLLLLSVGATVMRNHSMKMLSDDF